MKAPSKIHKFIESNGYKYSKDGYCKFPFNNCVSILINFNKVGKDKISLDWCLCYPYADDGAFTINPDIYEVLWEDGTIRNERSFKAYEYIYNPKNIDLLENILNSFFQKWESLVLDIDNLINAYNYVLDLTLPAPTQLEYFSELDIIRLETFKRVSMKAACLNVAGKFQEALSILEKHPIILENSRRNDQPLFCKLLSDAQNGKVMSNDAYMKWAIDMGFKN